MAIETGSSSAAIRFFIASHNLSFHFKSLVAIVLMRQHLLSDRSEQSDIYKVNIVGIINDIPILPAYSVMGKPLTRFDKGSP